MKQFYDYFCLVIAWIRIQGLLDPDWDFWRDPDSIEYGSENLLCCPHLALLFVSLPPVHLLMLLPAVGDWPAATTQLFQQEQEEVIVEYWVNKKLGEFWNWFGVYRIFVKRGTKSPILELPVPFFTLKMKFPHHLFIKNKSYFFLLIRNWPKFLVQASEISLTIFSMNV